MIPKSTFIFFLFFKSFCFIALPLQGETLLFYCSLSKPRPAFIEAKLFFNFSNDSIGFIQKLSESGGVLLEIDSVLIPSKFNKKLLHVRLEITAIGYDSFKKNLVLKKDSEEILVIDIGEINLRRVFNNEDISLLNARIIRFDQSDDFFLEITVRNESSSDVPIFSVFIEAEMIIEAGVENYKRYGYWQGVFLDWEIIVDNPGKEIDNVGYSNIMDNKIAFPGIFRTPGQFWTEIPINLNLSVEKIERIYLKISEKIGENFSFILTKVLS